MDKKLLQDIKSFWRAGIVGINLICEEEILDFHDVIFESLETEEIISYYQIGKVITLNIVNNDYI